MTGRIFSLLFIIFIGGLFIMNVLGEDATFSEQENRFLAQKPSLNWKDFKSGKFTSEYETYISDQFPFKNQFVGVKGKMDRVIGKKENNDVLFGNDGYLLERFINEGERLDKNIKLMNTFAEQENMTYIYSLLAPTAIEIYQEKVPKYVSTLSQKETIFYIAEKQSPKIEMINVFEPLLNAKDQQIYFKTDHHWTMRGAYYAYVAAAKQMNFEPLSQNDFQIETVSESFRGTLYSKATAYDHDPDIIELFIPKKEPEVTVTYEDGTETSTMYTLEYLDKKDKYSLFLDGNHTLVKIETNANTGRTLAVIKDSFAHAFIPFLANHFDEIHVLDLRYYKGSVSAFMNDEDLSEVLFLYNLPNFNKDTSLGFLR